ncbi:MAG: hypothetical protein WAM62_17005, partial [Pseudolabrys sp.]
RDIVEAQQDGCRAIIETPSDGLKIAKLGTSMLTGLRLYKVVNPCPCMVVDRAAAGHIRSKP